MIRSTVLYTEEIDDIELAAEELLAQASDFKPEENSFGIVFMDAETEYEELYEHLIKNWDIPFIGASAIGMLTGSGGYHKSGISIMLLTSSDCRFAVGMTQGLSAGNTSEPIREIFEELEDELDHEEIKLVLTFGGKPKVISGDDIVNAIDELNKNVKVYGAFASDSFSFNDYQVICNERIADSEQAFVLMSGNVEPKFLSVQSLSGKVNFSYEVTKSDGNMVYRLGNGTFMEALKKSGLNVKTGVVVTDFIQTPFITTFDKPDGTHVEALRVLTSLNDENGSGMFLGGISEGSSLELGLLNRDDVKETVKNAFDEIFEWIKDEGKDCHTILCCSCVARFLALGNNGVIEAESYLGRLPKDISLMGFYSYGEFCPVGSANNCNVFHNYTFTILCI